MRTKEIEIGGEKVNKVNGANLRAEAAGSRVITLESTVKAFDDLFKGAKFSGNRVVVGKPDNLNNIEENTVFTEKVLSEEINGIAVGD